MPHDLNGVELKVGDKVVVFCEVTAVHPTEEACNVNLQVMLPAQGSDYKPSFVANTKQVAKV